MHILRLITKVHVEWPKGSIAKIGKVGGIRVEHKTTDYSLQFTIGLWNLSLQLLIRIIEHLAGVQFTKYSLLAVISRLFPEFSKRYILKSSRIWI